MTHHACHFNRLNRWWRWVTSVRLVVLGIGWVGKDYDLGGEGRADDDLSEAGISTLFSLLIIGHVCIGRVILVRVGNLATVVFGG